MFQRRVLYQLYIQNLMKLLNLFLFSGICGIPENLIQALLDTGKTGLTIVSNNAGK